MKLAYKAYDHLGKAIDGTIESPDVMAAAEALRRKGLFVAQVEPSVARAAPKRQGRLGLPFGRGRRIKNVAVFTRQLYVLLCSGTQLMEAIAALERQTKPGPWRDAVATVRDRIEEGASLSEALKNYPEYFDSVYRSCVAAGESSGYLAEMLDRLATLKQKQLRIRNAVMGALIYPSLLALVALTIFPMLLVFVVPRFASLFASLDVPLPSSTAFLVGVSALLRHYWWAALSLPVMAVGALAMFVRTPRGQRWRDTVMLRLPSVGGITRNLATARIVRLMAVLMEGHVPVLESLQFVRQAAGNVHYAELISRAEDHVLKGEPISLAFADSNLISPSVHEAIRSGEQSGRLDSLLSNVADFLDEENEVVVRSLASIVEPCILIIMGVLVGFIAVSMFMPLFDLTSMTQGGRP
ncbi:MAG: type II secretion system F family protein [Phycisphaerales bacterium]|nr:MAG: type II secretion system F family protein [Phycisphaerales bacterium]